MATSDAPITVDGITLVVHDLARVADFYEAVMGLAPLSRDAAEARFGADGRPLVTLRVDRAAARAAPNDPGLFHTAFLLPSRAALGGWLTHAAAGGVRIDGAADHVVSEALYLSDPEGNGVEVYADRPPSAWPWQDGAIAMRNDPLDLPALAADGAPWRGAPEGTVIGHVHLKAAALSSAEAFWGGTVGLSVTCRYPGATFFASGGYHHHIAANVWRTRGASPAAGPRTGLAAIALAARPENRPAVPLRPDPPDLAVTFVDPAAAATAVPEPREAV